MKHFSQLILLSLALLFVVGCATSPQKRAKLFYQSIEEGNYEAALEHTTLSVDEDSELHLAIMGKVNKSIEEQGGIEKIEFLREEPSQNDSLRTTVVSLITFGDGSSQEEYCNLVLVENEWIVDVNLDAK